jgi:hypothetical protein
MTALNVSRVQTAALQWNIITFKAVSKVRRNVLLYVYKPTRCTKILVITLGFSI